MNVNFTFFIKTYYVNIKKLSKKLNFFIASFLLFYLNITKKKKSLSK